MRKEALLSMATIFKKIFGNRDEAKPDHVTAVSTLKNRVLHTYSRCSGVAVANPGTAHRDRPAARLDLALRQVTVADDPPTPGRVAAARRS